MSLAPGAPRPLGRAGSAGTLVLLVPFWNPLQYVVRIPLADCLLSLAGKDAVTHIGQSPQK